MKSCIKSKKQGNILYFVRFPKKSHYNEVVVVFPMSLFIQVQHVFFLLVMYHLNGFFFSSLTSGLIYLKVTEPKYLVGLTKKFVIYKCRYHMSFNRCERSHCISAANEEKLSQGKPPCPSFS